MDQCDAVGCLGHSPHSKTASVVIRSGEFECGLLAFGTDTRAPRRSLYDAIPPKSRLLCIASLEQQSDPVHAWRLWAARDASSGLGSWSPSSFGDDLASFLYAFHSSRGAFGSNGPFDARFWCFATRVEEDWVFCDLEGKWSHWRY